jgi:hypothetical protein
MRVPIFGFNQLFILVNKGFVSFQLRIMKAWIHSIVLYWIPPVIVLIHYLFLISVWLFTAFCTPLVWRKAWRILSSCDKKLHNCMDPFIYFKTIEWVNSSMKLFLRGFPSINSLFLEIHRKPWRNRSIKPIRTCVQFIFSLFFGFTKNERRFSGEIIKCF